MKNSVRRLPLPILWKLGKMSLFLCLTTMAAAGALLLLETAQAQEGAAYDYVDLVMLHETAPVSATNSIEYSVRNAGRATAVGVIVSFHLEGLEIRKGTNFSPPPGTRTVACADGELACQEFSWNFGSLTPGETSKPLSFPTWPHSAYDTTQTNWKGRVGSINATASSDSHEPDILLVNNAIKVYSFALYSESRHMTSGGLDLLLSVDDLRPDAGGSVAFDLTARNGHTRAEGYYIYLTADASVKVELSRGLKFQDGWNPPDTVKFVKSGSQSATWYPPDTDTEATELLFKDLHQRSHEIRIETQLTPESLEEIPLEERCITAWVEESIPPPDPNNALGSFRQCLRDDPPVLFDSGEVDLMDIYSCVGANPVVYPCRSDSQGAVLNDLELLVSAEPRSHPQIRSIGIGRIDKGIADGGIGVALRPEKVVIQVKDPEGRRSTNSGVRWQTFSDDYTRGIDINETFTNRGTATWTTNKVRDKVSAVGLSGERPGTLSIKGSADNTEYTNADWDFPADSNIWYSFSDLLRVYYEMSELGTYVTTRSFRAERTGLSEPYTASATFHIHVGPVAELEVRDGGASPDLPASQRAHTIMAVNNGPDTAPAARVTLSGLNAGSCRGSATRGTIEFADNQCIWTIGELLTKDVSQAAINRDGELLTITTSAVDTEITAAISNTRDYQVCIDSSGDDVDADTESSCKPDTTSTNTWHTTNYYDYISDNNSASIAVSQGTGEHLLSAMQVGSVQATSFSWGRLHTLYGRPVTHYQVERSTDGGSNWTTMAGRWPSTTYIDRGAGIGSSLHYRARAVNDWNHKGPWSRFDAAALAGGDGEPEPPKNLRAKLNSGGSITLTWEPVDNLLYGDPVSHYEVQRQRGAWDTIANGVTDTEYTDFGAGGRMSPYRVRAVNTKGREGPWSDVIDVVGAEQRGIPAGPTLSAHTTTKDTIRLTWTVPSNQRDAVTGYELQYLDVDEWLELDYELGSDETEYEDQSLPYGAVRTYRVRARAGEDVGRWSNEVNAMTPPGYVSYFWAEANGHNAIYVLWDPPDDATEGRTVTRYELEVSSEGGLPDTWTRLTNPGSSARVFNHTGLQPEANRTYRIRACNGAGCSLWSWTAFATTAAQGVPSAPGLTASTDGQWDEWSEWAITLSWTKPNDGGSPIESYQLEHRTNEYDWAFLDGQIPPDDTEFVHQEYFNPGETHRYRVRAVNEKGESAWSPVRSVTVPARPPYMPELSFGESTDSTITLNWTVPEANGSQITGYLLERNDPGGDDTTWKTVANVGSSVTTYTDGNLWRGEYYSYRVSANSNVGRGEVSHSISARTTGESARPPDPPILRLSSVSPTGVTVAWDPPRYDGGRPVTGYVYEMSPFDYDCGYSLWDRDQWPPNKCHLVSSGTRSASFSGLTPGDFYQFRVRTETSYGNGQWAEVSASLPAGRDDSETEDVTEDLQVRVSTTSLTVNEGGEASYTVRLNKAPAEDETVVLGFSTDDSTEIFVDYSDDYSFEFSSDNWNSGFTFTLSAGEDQDAENEIAIMEHYVTVGGREVSGPSVRVEVRDND